MNILRPTVEQIFMIMTDSVVGSFTFFFWSFVDCLTKNLRLEKCFRHGRWNGSDCDLNAHKVFLHRVSWPLIHQKRPKSANKHCLTVCTAEAQEPLPCLLPGSCSISLLPNTIILNDSFIALHYVSKTKGEKMGSEMDPYEFVCPCPILDSQMRNVKLKATEERKSDQAFWFVCVMGRCFFFKSNEIKTWK